MRLPPGLLNKCLSRALKVTGLFLASIFLTVKPVLAAPACSEIFTVEATYAEPVLIDPRLKYETSGQKLLEIGEGNSGKIYLFKNEKGEFYVAKIYKPERKDNLVRDHQGLQLTQRLFDLDNLHNSNFKVAKSTIVDNFNGVPGQQALVMPYVPGFNLHGLLVSVAPTHPLHIQAVKLYKDFIRELDADAVRARFREELRDETERYFQDHIVDGQKMLVIDGNPRILIKTDNIIFNPADNSLTLVDPY